MTKKPTMQKNPAEKSKDAEPSTPPLKIILTSKCKTLSNKSTLTYNIAADDKDDLSIRIHSNTGGGFFSNEWIPFNNVTTYLNNLPADQPITSTHFTSLLKGKSVNTPGYLLAALLNEELLSPHQEIKRKFVFTGAESFLIKIEKLKASIKTK